MPECLDELGAIDVVAAAGPPFDPADHHMVEDARGVQSGLARHVSRRGLNRITMQRPVFHVFHAGVIQVVDHWTIRIHSSDRTTLIWFPHKNYIWQRVRITPHPPNRLNLWINKNLQKRTDEVGMSYGFRITPLGLQETGERSDRSSVGAYRWARGLSIANAPLR